jgi:hypothetical protein
MNEVERSEALVTRHLGLPPPWREPLCLASFEYVLSRFWEVAAFIDQGIDLVTDPVRKKVILKHLGPRNGTDEKDYNFNVWLANECIGPGPSTSRFILYRCLDCGRLRTHRQVAQQCCLCGGPSRRMDESLPSDLNTRMAMKALVMGR